MDAYALAGVDVHAGERAVERMRERIGGSGAGAVDLLGSLGGFGAAIALPEGYRQPVLVSATDGVGTKTEFARRLGRLDTIGGDLVAMCVDDVVCHGARPLFFLDYVAVGRLDPEAVATLVGGVADGCVVAGCALAGGETAEHPGLMADDAFDLAGFCVGIVERDELLDGSTARVGDVVVGIGSSGLHANGYSLVRRVVADHALDLDAPFASDPGATVTLGEALLRPTRIYAPHVLAVRAQLSAAGLRLSGIAHVTGGGLPGNLPRAIPGGLGIVVDPGAWPVPPIVSFIAGLAGLDGAGMRRIFNGGLGMALVVEPEAAVPAIGALAEAGLPAWLVGEVVLADETGPRRYIERS